MLSTSLYAKLPSQQNSPIVVSPSTDGSLNPEYRPPFWNWNIGATSPSLGSYMNDHISAVWIASFTSPHSSPYLANVAFSAARYAAVFAPTDHTVAVASVASVTLPLPSDAAMKAALAGMAEAFEGMATAGVTSRSVRDRSPAPVPVTLLPSDAADTVPARPWVKFAATMSR